LTQWMLTMGTHWLEGPRSRHPLTQCMLTMDTHFVEECSNGNGIRLLSNGNGIWLLSNGNGICINPFNDTSSLSGSLCSCTTQQAAVPHNKQQVFVRTFTLSLCQVIDYAPKNCSK